AKKDKDKSNNNQQTATTNPPGGGGGNNNQVGMHGPTGVVTNPGLGGGGSGGPGQAVRKAVARAATQNDMKNLHTYHYDASLASGKMPTAKQIFDDVQKGAPNIAKLITDKVIVLTGAKTRESIWAYTSQEQSTAGYYLAISNNGVEQLSAAQLNQRLKQ